MKIEINKLYENKTWRFLVPCLQAYGHVFVDKINPLFKLAVGIHDTYLDGADISKGNNLYFLIDKLVNNKQYEAFYDYIQYQPFYKGDYCPDVNILKSRKHMFIIEVPQEHNTTYNNFLKGKYSEMYTKEQIQKIFKNSLNSNTVGVLLKNDPKIFESFKDTVEKEFRVITNPLEIRKGEWELPLKKTEEIFNCGTNETVYFNEQIDKIWQ